MAERRRPQSHIRTVKGKKVPVNPFINYSPTTRDDARRHRGHLLGVAENPGRPLFDVDTPLDRDLVAATYGEQWRDADLRVTKVLTGYAAVEYEMDPRHVNYLTLPGVDPVDALRSYFAEVAQRHPDYKWGEPDSWSEDFAFETLLLFDDDAHHHAAGIISKDDLAAHGIQVLDTQQADWNPDYHEYSREKYSFLPHRDAEPMRFPDQPYEPHDHNAALDELARRGAVDATEFSVLLWLGEIELRDNSTYAATSDGYDPERNHIPPWAIDRYLDG